MANYQISANQIAEGKNVVVRGKLGFARLTRLIEGDELKASDQRKVQNGMSPIGRPHTTVTVTDAKVEYADPTNPTLEEQFVAERLYASKKNPDSGLNYSIDNKSTTLPVIGVLSDKADGSFDQDTSGQELAQGLDVSLVLRTFKPKNYNNRGLALEQVLVNETPRYYNAGGVDSKELAARGIVFNNAPRAVSAAEASPVGDAPEVEVGTDVEDGLAFPAPQPTAQVAAVAAPAATEETVEQKLARLQAENAALKNSGSAIGAPATSGPWDDEGQTAGITYQG